MFILRFQRKISIFSKTETAYTFERLCRCNAMLYSNLRTAPSQRFKKYFVWLYFKGYVWRVRCHYYAMRQFYVGIKIRLEWLKSIIQFNLIDNYFCFRKKKPFTIAKHWTLFLRIMRAINKTNVIKIGITITLCY